jgi:hypothetical protein
VLGATVITLLLTLSVFTSGLLFYTRFAMITARFLSASCLAYTSSLKMEATLLSETSVDFYRITRRYSQNIVPFMTLYMFRS